MKKVISFIIILTMLMSIWAITANAAVSEDLIKLFDDTTGAAPAHGDGHIVITWANYCGMKFDIKQDELFTGVTFRTIIANVRIHAALYKWNTKLEDKELLEEKELQSVDWLQVNYDFQNVYGAGTYYVEIKTFGDTGNEPYLYAQKKIITDRNVASYQYDKTWAELNISSGKDFGEGFDMSIKIQKGVTPKAQSFLTKYKEAKTQGVTIYDQTKYDTVITAVGSDLKAFMISAADETFINYTNDLIKALTAPTNPSTSDVSLAPYITMSILACAIFVVFAVKKVNLINK